MFKGSQILWWLQNVVYLLKSMVVQCMNIVVHVSHTKSMVVLSSLT